MVSVESCLLELIRVRHETRENKGGGGLRSLTRLLSPFLLSSFTSSSQTQLASTHKTCLEYLQEASCQGKRE